MDALTQIPLTANLADAAFIVTAGSASTLATANTYATAVNYAIKGKIYHKAVATGITTPTTDATTAAAFVALAASQGCVFVVGLDSSGNWKASQGGVQTLDSSNSFVIAPQFPAVPDTICPIAYIVCKNGSTGSAWTFGTSNWNATGMTTAAVGVCTLPDRPQIA